MLLDTRGLRAPELNNTGLPIALELLMHNPETTGAGGDVFQLNNEIHGHKDIIILFEMMNT